MSFLTFNVIQENHGISTYSKMRFVKDSSKFGVKCQLIRTEHTVQRKKLKSPGSEIVTPIR